MVWQNVSYKNSKAYFEGVSGRDENGNYYDISFDDKCINISINKKKVLFFKQEDFSEIFNTVLFQTKLYEKPKGYDDVSPWITTKKPKPKDLYPRHT